MSVGISDYMATFLQSYKIQIFLNFLPITSNENVVICSMGIIHQFKKKTFFKKKYKLNFLEKKLYFKKFKKKVFQNIFCLSIFDANTFFSMYFSRFLNLVDNYLPDI